MTDPPGPPRPILVAVDGSPESAAALRWARDHAAACGHPLRVVTAYDEPTCPVVSIPLPQPHIDLVAA